MVTNLPRTLMFFSLSCDDSITLRLPPTQKNISMASRSQRLLSLTRRAFSSSQHVGGVSMVQGASRGIGLEFVKQLLEKNDKEHVVATCRNPSASTGLLNLKDQFSDRLQVLPLDLTDESSIQASALSIKEAYGHLNLLINASGILSIPQVLQPETTLNKLEKSSLMLAYEINAVGPILVIKHMWPLLKTGGGTGTERSAAVVASLSARVGSIGDNHLGGWHSYRSSKTALNQLSKTVSVEFARKKDPIICILLHPGTVDTDLSKPFQKNVPKDKLFTKQYSVEKMLSIINSVKSNDNGKFFAWDGQEIPWRGPNQYTRNVEEETGTTLHLLYPYTPNSSFRKFVDSLSYDRTRHLPGDAAQLGRLKFLFNIASRPGGFASRRKHDAGRNWILSKIALRRARVATQWLVEVRVFNSVLRFFKGAWSLERSQTSWSREK